MSSTPATPDTDRKKGPWANRIVSSEVVHTPEYEEFIKILSAYHEKRGTTLAIEPELGRKLLDLRKLYETVTKLGGYDVLTETKGAWRDLANTYKPPINNTNAGYLLKTIYYKNLAAYEIENFFKKEPPPKEWLEERSAAGGAIMTRTAEDFQAQTQSPKPETNGDSSSPPPTTERRSLRAAPTPRSFFAPDTTPQRHNPPRGHSGSQQPYQNQPHNQQHHQMHHGSSNGVNGAATAHYPTFQLPIANAPIGRPVSTPRNAPHEFVGRRKRMAEANGGSNQPRFGAGHQGANMMHRITMALKSGIPTETGYALSSLVRISFEYGDELQVFHIPGLPEILFGMLKDLQPLVDNYSIHGKYDNVDHTEYTGKLEKINEAALILRNMALNMDNARQFAALLYPKDVLVMGLNLPTHANLLEVKNYMLDMTESMAPFLPHALAQNDPLIDAVGTGLGSDDRGVLLGSLRAMCRLVIGRDEYNRIGGIPIGYVSRITSLLMIEDDDLVSACLDFLYQYTTNEENVNKLLRPPIGYETIRQLSRLLLFQGITGEQLVYIRTLRKPRQPSGNIPDLPQEIVNDLLTFPEPQRATEWMRCCFEEDPEADITQIALWQAYQARFTEYVQTGFHLLPAAEFIKNVSVAFTTASAMVLPTTQGQKFIIKGIRARETPRSIKGHIYLACKWHHTPGVPNSQCRNMLATPQELWAHVQTVHLATSAEPRPYFCSWSGCTRFGINGESNRLKVVAHARTHMPDNTKFHLLSKEDQEMMEDPEGRVIIKRCQTNTDERGEAAGIPLTSVLVLRNIKRRGGETADNLLRNCKEELYEVMALNKPLAPYVADLLVDG